MLIYYFADNYYRCYKKIVNPEVIVKDLIYKSFKFAEK